MDLEKLRELTSEMSKRLEDTVLETRPMFLELVKEADPENLAEFMDVIGKLSLCQWLLNEV